MTGLRNTGLDLLALASGAVIPLAFAPFGLWPLALAGPLVFLLTLETASPKRGFWRGWLMGFGFFGTGVSWVFVSIHEFGGTSVILASLMVLLFVASLAIFGAVKGWLFCLGRRLFASGWQAIWLFALVWVFEEWLRGWLLGGFPWLYLGYAFRETWLAGWAPVGGVLFLGALVLLTVGMLRQLIRSAAGFGSLPAAAVLILIWGAGLALCRVNWTRPTDTLEVALVQGNVHQLSKWHAPGAVNQLYKRLTEPHLPRADLVVWPEGAVVRFQHLNRDFLQEMAELALAAETSLVLGLPVYDASLGGYHNSALALGLGKGIYHKRRLVPFGEYLPLESWLRGTIEFFSLPMSRHRPGPHGQKLLQLGSHSLGMAICYEITYPSLVRGRDGQLPDLLATISNDSWFGNSTGPHQHLEMAQMRALELGRDLVRATNDGITAIVAADGRVRAQLPRFQEAVLTGRVQIRSGLTPYARSGQLFLLLLVLLLAAGLLPCGRRSAAPSG